MNLLTKPQTFQPTLIAQQYQKEIRNNIQQINNNNNNNTINTNIGNNSNVSHKEKTLIDQQTKLRIINDCRLYKQRKVAEMYNIHPTTVSKILKESDQIVSNRNGNNAQKDKIFKGALLFDLRFE